MTAMKIESPIAGCRLPVDFGKEAPHFLPAQQRHAFTLIELLTVIFIIGVLAAFAVPVLHGVARLKYINTAKAEMGQLETAIDSYHADYGFYPPDNPTNVLINQLYYELTGTTNINTAASPVYQPLDGSSPAVPAFDVATAFGAAGFVNCAKSGAEDTVPARDFLPELRPNQVYRTFTNSTTGTQGIAMLVTSVGGPDTLYQPLGLSGLNPWRYKSSGTLTNNPGEYELYVQLVISGKSNLVCNWNKTVQINSPLP
jgi:prepilin-type N-terminal cleavage/methylation domain-containing protein